MILNDFGKRISGKKLIENYSYTRIYKKGDVLNKHIDREECEIEVCEHVEADIGVELELCQLALHELPEASSLAGKRHDK